MQEYKLYLTNSIEQIDPEATLFNSASSFTEARKKIVAYLNEQGIERNPYWRWLLAEDATYIDFGSWSKFVAITPPVSMKEMMKD